MNLVVLCKHCHSVITIHLLYETSVYAAFSVLSIARLIVCISMNFFQDFRWINISLLSFHRFCIPLLILSISTKRSGNCISMSFFQDWRKKEVMVTMDPVLFVTRHACRYSLCSCQILLLHFTADIYIESSYSTLLLILMSNPLACVKRLVFMSTAEHKQVLWVHICLCSSQLVYCENSFLTLL
jgi:hypothetical protein